jgi:hypothetical protein
MNHLPHDSRLPINTLSTCLKSKVTTYKFYWFLSLLEVVKSGKYEIDKKELFSLMIAKCWYTVNYFNLNYGHQDKLQTAVKLMVVQENLTIDEKKEAIMDRLLNTHSKESKKTILHFDAEVPHRFLSPWFPAIKGEIKDIYALSQTFTNNCPYALNNTTIIINPDWIEYLQSNVKILEAFCQWELCLYLQKRNPNVPDIANKLFKLPVRNSLIKQKKEFWDIVIEKLGPVNCIYTNTSLNIGTYAVEHFVPFAFVSHDLLWNLIPADRRFNSSKSDKLPQLDRYFDKYFNLQYTALKTVFNVDPKSKILQDYLTILPDLSLLNTMDEDDLKHKFLDNVQPLITIASNNGFEFMINKNFNQ